MNPTQERGLDDIWRETAEIRNNSESKTYHLVKLLDSATPENHDAIVERFSDAIIEGKNHNLTSLDMQPRHMKDYHLSKIAGAINASRIRSLRIGAISFPTRSNGLGVFFDGLVGDKIESMTFLLAEGIPTIETIQSVIQFLCRCTALKKFDVMFSDATLRTNENFLTDVKGTLDQIFDDRLKQQRHISEEKRGGFGGQGKGGGVYPSHRARFVELHAVKAQPHVFTARGVAELPLVPRVTMSVSVFPLQSAEKPQLWQDLKHMLLRKMLTSYTLLQHGHTPLALWPHLMERMDALQGAQTESSSSLYISVKYHLMRQQTVLWQKE